MSDMESKARMSTSTLCSHFKLSTFSSFPALLLLSYNSFLDRDAGSENVPPSCTTTVPYCKLGNA